jgi:hypothetical protein
VREQDRRDREEAGHLKPEGRENER